MSLREHCTKFNQIWSNGFQDMGRSKQATKLLRLGSYSYHATHRKK